MAMTKEQQKEASDRIMAKMGPLDDQEQETYELLTKRVEDYVPPQETGERVCGVCGAKFQDLPATRDRLAVSALEQFSDHQSEHNPSPSQWAEAHRRIQDGKERHKADT